MPGWGLEGVGFWRGWIGLRECFSASGYFSACCYCWLSNKQANSGEDNDGMGCVLID